MPILMLSLLLTLPTIDDAEAIPVDAVRQTLQFLASDTLAGRDTPSRGQRIAAEYLVQRFREAGLDPLVGDSFLVPFEKPGVQLDATRIVLEARVDDAEVELIPERDFRWFSGDASFSGADVELVRIAASGDDLRTVMRQQRGESPLLLEIEEESPLWQECVGARDVMESRRSRRVVLLLRKGALPPGRVVATIEIPSPNKVTLALENVGAIRRGATRPNEWILFSAHYDHIGLGLPNAEGDAIYNGADDDASGTTAVVQLGAAFGNLNRPTERSVAFVCFSGEEKGLLGSRALSESGDIPLEQIVAMINIEMIGRPEEGKRNSAWITGPGYSNLRALLTPGFEASGVQMTEFKMANPLFNASDNAPFARRGVVAHSVSAGSLHADYHGVDDEVDRVDIEHMTQVIRALFASGRQLADGADRPAFTEEGERAIESASGR